MWLLIVSLAIKDQKGPDKCFLSGIKYISIETSTRFTKPCMNMDSGIRKWANSV